LGSEKKRDGKRKSKDKVENAEEKRLIKWIGSIEREQTRERRRRMDVYRYQRGNSDRLRNSK
jgi:hypothetical protein